MNSNIRDLLTRNIAWAKGVEEKYPGFFKENSGKQAPKYLWLGCSDSRVPETLITGSMPGEIFVHRNISNQVTLKGDATMEVIEFAVNHLEVEHIIICGHYGCGAVQAVAEDNLSFSHTNWYANLSKIRNSNLNNLDINDPSKSQEQLSELNVKAQVERLASSELIINAWKDRKPLSIHGFIYRLKSGLLKDLEITVSEKTN